MEVEMKTIECIPYDILIQILQYLPISDLLFSAQYVNRNWHDIIHDSILWNNVSFKPPLGMKSAEVVTLLKNAPFLKSFEFREGLKTDEIIDTLCEFNKCIVSLSFTFHLNEQRMQKIIKHFPELECIELSFTEFVNNLKSFGQFRKLKKVKCTRLFQNSIVMRRGSTIAWAENDWPSLTSLEILNEHVDGNFESMFELVGKRLLNLHIQAVRSPTALSRIKGCTRLEHLKLDFLSRQLGGTELVEIFTGLKNLRYLKYLCLRSFVHPDAHILCKVFDKVQFTQLVELDLKHCLNFTYHVARSIAKACPKLEVISLHGCSGLDDTCLKELSECARLRILDIAGCRFVTEKGLSYLAGCVHLQELNLNWMGVVSSPMLDQLAKIRNLQTLHLDKVELNFNHLVETIRAMPKLIRLSFHNHGMEGELLQNAVPHCQVNFKKQDLQNFIKEKASSLNLLELHGVPNDALESLNVCKNLEKLSMNFLMRPSTMFVNFVPVIQNFEKLRVLILKCFVATEEGLLSRLLSNGLSELKELNLEFCLSVNQDVAETIAKFHPKLELLHLKGSVSLNDEGFLAITKMKLLSNLNISGCQGLTGKSLMQLCECVSLKDLNMCGMAPGAVNEEVIQSIVSLNNLKALSVDNSFNSLNETWFNSQNWYRSHDSNCGMEITYVPSV